MKRVFSAGLMAAVFLSGCSSGKKLIPDTDPIRQPPARPPVIARPEPEPAARPEMLMPVSDINPAIAVEDPAPEKAGPTGQPPESEDKPAAGDGVAASTEVADETGPATDVTAEPAEDKEQSARKPIRNATINVPGD